MGERWTVIEGECVAAMAAMEAESVHAVVTDPPYGLEFMGKEWDKLGTGDKRRIVVPEAAMGYQDGNGGNAYSRSAVRFTGGPTGARAMQDWHTEWAIAALRVLKPGGHLLAFGGTRTFHRLAVAIEDAGFEIRDTISWLYASGFPKSLDVSKAIDKAADYPLKAAIRRAAVEAVEAAGLELPSNSRWDWTTGEHAPGDKWWAIFREWLPSLSDDDRERIEGRIVATIRKTAGWFTSKDIYDVTAPATDAAKQWAGWGTALKPAWEPIIVARKPLIGTVAANVQRFGTGAINVDACKIGTEAITTHNTPGVDKFKKKYGGGLIPKKGNTQHIGRWPPNVAMDSEVAGELDAVAGPRQAGNMPANRNGSYFTRGGETHGERVPLDGGGASRFFYVAKPSKAERDAGCGDNGHPTVKPITLLRHLVRLVTPPDGIVMDPFCGSGTTGCAAVLEGFRFVGIEREAEYWAIAEARVAHWAGKGRQLPLPY